MAFWGGMSSRSVDMLGWMASSIEGSPSSPALLPAGRRGQVCKGREPRELRWMALPHAPCLYSTCGRQQEALSFRLLAS